MPQSHSQLPSLTVAISTFGQRLTCHTLDPFPATDGVGYVLILQWPTEEPLPEALQNTIDQLSLRDDVRCAVQHATKGVAKSRNLAIEMARTDLLLFCDDDIKPNIEGWRQLRQKFAQMSDVSFLCGRLQTPDGEDRKNYRGDQMQRVHRLNSLRIGTPELAIRCDDIVRHNISFHTEFGAGSDNPVGDEAIFVRDMLAAKLRGFHTAIRLGSHPAESSGLSLSRADLALRLPLFKELFGYSAPLFRTAFALRNRARIGSAIAIFRFAFGKR